jgi:hypothetical protein
MSTISAIILTKNEEMMIGDCLASLDFCQEIIVIDSASTDKTVALAKEKHAKVFTDTSDDYAAKRNLGRQVASGEWLFYIDADERVSDELRESVLSLLENKAPQIITARPAGPQDVSEIGAYRIKRKNFYLGNNPWPAIERMERLFKKSALKGWEGSLHESPQVSGKISELDGYLVHYTHRNLTQMVSKTNTWSETEAALRLSANHPVMTWWRFPRVMVGAFFDSFIKQGGWKIGTPGLIESMYQAFSVFITYAKLWELQGQPERRIPEHEK